MRHHFTLLLLPAICMSLAADTTGSITGRVLTKDGQPVPNAVITLKRTDINFTKEVKADAKGKFIQVGLSPVEFDFTVHAEGYENTKDHFKVNIGEMTKKDFVLYTPAEASALQPSTSNVKAVISDPGAQLEDAGYAAFNEATTHYNAKQWKQAEPLFSKAFTSLNESLAQTKDEEAKAKIQEKLKTVSRVYGVVLYEVGKMDNSTEKFNTAKPLLEKALEANEKDGRVVEALLNIAKETKDKEATAKYQAAMDAIVGPRPENAYNDGVAAYNANKFKEAKEFILKAISINKDFPDSYYLLGLIETNNNNLKAAKDAFKKCLELAPAGKHAAECKESIKEL